MSQRNSDEKRSWECECVRGETEGGREEQREWEKLEMEKDKKRSREGGKRETE